MAPKYHLLYFNGKARGEPIRWILEQAGQEYVDERIEFADWPKKKSSTPFGKLPVLYVNGSPLSETTAICRFLGRSHDLAPTSDWESAKCDEMVDAFNDVFSKAVEIKFESDEAARKGKLDKFSQEMLPGFLKVFEASLKPGCFLISSKVTWADLFICTLMDTLDNFTGQGKQLCNYPKVKALMEKIHSLPKIAAWIARRPSTSI